MAWSMGVAGWCTAENGDPDRAIAQIAQAVGRMQSIQSRHFLCYLLGLLADDGVRRPELAHETKLIVGLPLRADFPVGLSQPNRASDASSR
jgi:hypothetical protein